MTIPPYCRIQANSRIILLEALFLPRFKGCFAGGRTVDYDLLEEDTSQRRSVIGVLRRLRVGLGFFSPVSDSPYAAIVFSVIACGVYALIYLYPGGFPYLVWLGAANRLTRLVVEHAISHESSTVAFRARHLLAALP